ncbi:HAMP domain-containing sensor histidine kinase [Paraglaciecola sp.]|uniref:sensor histidine kinase n=1 Tax=Paraglaciecola sp. TaxID=1920173 RepID=UPI00273CF6FB|nr:ATP-binding protein [Paraglaciecola sp.]MDP5029163.1 ATP-binding protein [Paraglaciecola sp.]
MLQALHHWTNDLVNTLGFKRLFWRIFIAFWLTSMLVMFATGFVMVNSFSSAEAHQRYIAEVTTQAERMVWRYENDGFSSDKLASKIKQWEQKQSGRSERLIPMRIVDKNQHTIYRYRLKKENIDELEHVSILGPSNIEYQVYVAEPEPPRIFKQVLFRFQSLQFVFILFASALVSALLSWSIVAPLKSLGIFSRRFANQQQVTELPSKLLQRGDELGALAHDIDYMVKQTQKTVLAQQQLLHDVSHELRAPLARLQVSAALIEQKMPENRHALQINSDCVRIDQLIQQILNYSKLEQDQQSAQRFDIQQLCLHVIENMAVQYPDVPIKFDSALSECEIKGFPEAFHQALGNIIGNACKYSPTAKPVEVSLARENNEVTLSIRDHGEGVDEAELSQLLRPFYRAGNHMHTPGFGLGLSIAARAINKHQGQLQMENQREGGLLVTITVPVL